MSSAAGKGSFYSEKVDKDEEKEFETGPLSILMHSVKQNTQVDNGHPFSPLHSLCSPLTLFRFLLIVEIIINYLPVSKHLIDIAIWF